MRTKKVVLVKEFIAMEVTVDNIIRHFPNVTVEVTDGVATFEVQDRTVKQGEVMIFEVDTDNMVEVLARDEFEGKYKGKRAK